MLIEKEIPANYFRNNYHKTLVNIWFTSGFVLEKLKQVLESDDLTPQQYNILRILKLSGKPLSTLKIREQMLDKMSDTSRIVERLVKKELVNKCVSTHDKRLVDVTLTEKGVQLLHTLDEKAAKIDSTIANLSDDEVQTLNSLLDKVRDKV